MNFNKKKIFKYSNIHAVTDENSGIYSFWYNKKCIYVGETTLQSIRQRLLDHYSHCHNYCLKNWIKSSFTLYFNYQVIESVELIKIKEDSLIKFWDPVCNIKGKKI